MSETVIVTGAAGFIGYHTAKNLLSKGKRVVAIDNFNDYYSVSLKEKRCEMLSENPNFSMHRLDIADAAALRRVFELSGAKHTIHLAAQAGVRYSVENPGVYVQSNLVGFANILECCRHLEHKHLVYASTSSVFGLNRTMPLSPHAGADHPVSFYAATKKANESMAHSYSHLFDLPTTGLRFFTVYGPWGRPDMALFKFTKAILAGQPIDVYNNGVMIRDFTYVEDIVEGVVRSLDAIPTRNPNWDAFSPDPATSSAPYRIFSIGNSVPVNLMDFIGAIENELRKKAIMNFMPIQPGDVMETNADPTALMNATGYKPSTTVNDGIKAFVAWYRDYFGE